MKEQLLIKRSWNDTQIHICIEEGRYLQVDCPVDSFIKRLEEELIKEMPYIMRTEKQMKDSLNKAWETVTKELKEELRRIA